MIMIIMMKNKKFQRQCDCSLKQDCYIISQSLNMLNTILVKEVHCGTQHLSVCVSLGLLHLNKFTSGSTS